jgi:hypothetical protein
LSRDYGPIVLRDFEEDLAALQRLPESGRRGGKRIAGRDRNAQLALGEEPSAELDAFGELGASLGPCSNPLLSRPV